MTQRLYLKIITQFGKMEKVPFSKIPEFISLSYVVVASFLTTSSHGRNCNVL